MKKLLGIILFQFVIVGFLSAQSYYTGGFAFGTSALGLGVEASFGKSSLYKLWGSPKQIYLGGGVGVYGQVSRQHDMSKRPFVGTKEDAFSFPLFAEARVFASQKKFALFYGLRFAAENASVVASYFDKQEEMTKYLPSYYRLSPSLTPLGGFRWQMSQHLILNLRLGLEFRAVPFGNAGYITPLMSWVLEFR